MMIACVCSAESQARSCPSLKEVHGSDAQGSVLLPDRRRRASLGGGRSPGLVPPAPLSSRGGASATDAAGSRALSLSFSDHCRERSQQPEERQERHPGRAASHREHHGPSLECPQEGGGAEEARGPPRGHEGVLFRLL